MTKFISIEGFLLLRDPYCEYFRSVHAHGIQAYQWVQYYNCAKANWEKFGDSGPPIGTEVITLRSGHCGIEGGVRTLLQIEDGFGGPFFILQRKATGGFAGAYKLEDDCVSMAEVSFWWLHFTVPEFSPFKRGRGWGT